jgi:dienelactone hydrolase
VATIDGNRGWAWGFGLALVALAGCGSEVADGATSDGSGGGSTNAGGSGVGGSEPSGPILDPATPGPFATTTFDASPTLATGDTENVACVLPEGASTGAPYPLVVLLHGFLGNNAMMRAYAERLATFGYVACAVEFPSSFTDSENPRQVAVVRAAIDWLVAASDDAASPLAGSIDPARIGITGHSLGGKISLLVASEDTRVRASITLDPVDGGGPTGCNAPACVDASERMPQVAIPTGFLGETIDAMTTGFQACAPAADNYATFYAAANAPSLSVTDAGANHVSFIGMDGAGFCNAPEVPAADVVDLSLAFVTAFYERHLRGLEGYDAYLTGTEAQVRYVDTGRATIESK